MAENEDTKNIPTWLGWAEQKAQEAKQKLAEQQEQEEAEPRQMFLPGMKEVMRVMPNHLARSSLFAPVARGRRKMHDKALLESRADAEIRFSGKQLDEAQADVWMQALKEAMRQPLGTPVTIQRAAFLREIGRTITGPNYDWLNKTMHDLAFAMLTIKVRSNDGKSKLAVGDEKALHLINGYDYDAKQEQYTLTIDPRWHSLFENREFALIDWNKRRAFGPNQDMAKTLQRLIATSSNSVQRYSLDWLKKLMDYTSPDRKYRAALERACKELERVKVIARYKLEQSSKGNMQLALYLANKEND